MIPAREGTSLDLYAAAVGPDASGYTDSGRYAAAERFAKLIDGGPGSATTTVTPDTALAVSALYACVTLIVRMLSTLPLQTFTERPDGTTVRVRDAQADMLEYQPNPQQSASTYYGVAVAHLILRGNFYYAKQRNTAGRVIATWPLHPDRVVPWRDENGNKWFQVTGADGTVAHYSGYHVGHVLGMSFGTGLQGHSVVDVHRRTLEADLAATEQTAKLFEQGLNVKAVMKVPYDLDATSEQGKQLRRDIRTFYSGTANAGSVLLLEQGIEFDPVSITPHDAEFLATRRHTATEVASWLGVPPADIGADSGGSLRYESPVYNDLNLLKKCVRYWKRRIEDDLYIDPDLFGLGSGRFCRFNVDALLEVDIMTRMQSYEIGTRIGLYAPNDVAAIEGHDPKDDDVSGLTRPQLQLALAAAKSSSEAVAAQRSRDAQIEARAAQAPPSVTVSPAPVNVEVNVPEQPAPVVNIATAEQPAPVVNVNVPEQPAPVVQVDVAAPDVTVDVAAPTVNVDPIIEIPTPAAKTVIFERDRVGNITEATIQEQ